MARLLPMTTIAILGAGKIGEALLAGLVRAGRSPDTLMLSRRSPERADELSRRYGVRAVDNPTAAKEADVLVVSVKPQDIEPLLGQIAPTITQDTLVLSLAAGLPTALYERHLPEGIPVVRAMPNTPILIGEAMSAISAGSHATSDHLQVVEELLSSVGKVVRVPESQQDAVTALSGSGPAYFFFLVEAMIDAGILLGLPRTLAGAEGAAARMARDYSSRLAARIAPIVIEHVDERLTTVTAERTLAAHGVRGRARRAVVDQAAAVVLLQHWLDMRPVDAPPPGPSRPQRPPRGT